MSTILKQSTQIKVRVGPFVDVGDGFTPETGITLGAADEAELLKANGAATVDISGATWAAVTGADGWYDLTLTTSHTDTVGELIVVVHDDSVCLPVFTSFQVIEEALYDAIFAASANAFSGAAGSTTLTALAANSVTAAVIADGAIDATAIATGAIDADSLAADATTEITAGIAASVNAEVLDVLNVDTFAEPTGVPAATQTIQGMIHFLYSFLLRNKVTVTATKKTYYDDGGASEFEKDLSDNGTTYEESEVNAP